MGIRASLAEPEEVQASWHGRYSLQPWLRSRVSEMMSVGFGDSVY